MAKAMEPVATIELDRPRKIRLDFEALMFIEEETGHNLLTEEGWAVFDDPSARTLAALLAGLLQHEAEDEEDKITVKGAARLLHLGNLEYVMKKIMEVMEKGTGTKAEEVKKGKAKGKKAAAANG